MPVGSALLFIPLIYLIVVGLVLWLAFRLVSAIVRISQALEGVSQSLELIAAKYRSMPQV